MTTISGVIFWRWEVPLTKRERERENFGRDSYDIAPLNICDVINISSVTYSHIFFRLSRYYIVCCRYYSIIFLYVQKLFNFLQWISLRGKNQFKSFHWNHQRCSWFFGLIILKLSCFNSQKIFKFELITSIWSD